MPIAVKVLSQVAITDFYLFIYMNKQKLFVNINTCQMYLQFIILFCGFGILADFTVENKGR